MKPFTLILLAFSLYFSMGAYADSDVRPSQQVNELLDGLHTAASQANLEKYLDSFTANGVFMGTDDWERWTRPVTLDQYVSERFAGGTGWTYVPLERNLIFSENRNTAWFDEIIVSKKWGRFRGAGTVIKLDGQWKIAHYAMSFLVPNEVWENVSELSTEAFTERAKNN
ncbi:MAG: nuclear transport factor 2 family protein [Paraglaciecola sp.]|uniref:nuclear transport factor 2 family protein n=2 Tax=Paraglaciecola sp. TaxID=1920173 RepID=UPI003265152F